MSNGQIKKAVGAWVKGIIPEVFVAGNKLANRDNIYPECRITQTYKSSNPVGFVKNCAYRRDEDIDTHRVKPFENANVFRLEFMTTDDTATETPGQDVAEQYCEIIKNTVEGLCGKRFVITDPEASEDFEIRKVKITAWREHDPSESSPIIYSHSISVRFEYSTARVEEVINTISGFNITATNS